MTQDEVAANLRRNAAYRTRHPERRWETILKSRHGIDGQVYSFQLVAQFYACAICLVPFTNTTNSSRPNIDHDHNCCKGTKKSCGKCFRGLLCGNCNRLLGLAFDNPKILENAREYLINGAFYSKL